METDAAKLRSHFLHVLRSRRPSPSSTICGTWRTCEGSFLSRNSIAKLHNDVIPNGRCDQFQGTASRGNFLLGLRGGVVLSVMRNHSRGYMAVAIDSRYHGERAASMTTYRDALVSSWKNGDTMPFMKVWDLIKLADYLAEREDVDPSKIGITGESLGGMHAWFAAFVDTRYSVVVPIIGVEGFRWAIEHDKWQARVNSIKAVFEEASADLDKSTIDKEVVQKVFPSGEDDPRCPLDGLKIPESRARKAYEEAICPQNFKLIAQPGIGHQMTPLMIKEASDWFDRFLKV